MPTLSRRTLLRGSGAALALPLLDAMRPAFGKPADPEPRRLLAVCTNLGVYGQSFFPEQAGRDFALTPYLEPFEDLRDQFTIVSGTSHGDVTGGHSAEATFLTAAPHPGTASFKNSISLDQFAAERIGVHTRVPALPLVVAKNGNQSLSFTSSGVMVPAENSPSKVYRSLFVAGDAAAVEEQLHRLRTGRSILDSGADRAATLRKSLGPGDRDRIDQYFTSVREVERRMLVSEEWEKKPKPQPSMTLVSRATTSSTCRSVLPFARSAALKSPACSVSGLDAAARDWWQTAVLYQLVHGLGLVAVGILARLEIGRLWLSICGWCFIVGVAMFCGALYALALGAPSGVAHMAPVGGAAFVVGWLAMLTGALRGR